MITIPTTHFDKRGSHKELFDKKMLSEKSLQNVLRGLYVDMAHETKLTIIHGKIFHVVVDLKTKKTEIHQISDQRQEEIVIPSGCAYGYLVLSELAIVVKKGKGLALNQSIIQFDDPDLALDWPIKYPILSSRDKKASTYAEILAHIETRKALI